MVRIAKIEGIRNSYMDNKKKLSDEFPLWNPQDDVRLTMFSKCINVLNSLQLSLVYIDMHLINHDWWKNITAVQLSQQNIQIYINEFDGFTKVGFIQSFFSAFESSMRLIVKSIDINACNNGTSEFKSIYSYLLKKLNQQYNEPLFDLLRLIRNTIHNNGVYYHKKNQDESILYNGGTYDFIIGKPINFVTWDFMFELLIPLETAFLEIVKHTEIKNIDHIFDPSSSTQ